MSTPNPAYTLSQMRAYLEGTMTGEAAQKMEAALASDPLLAGAMERLEADMDRQAHGVDELASFEKTFRDAIPQAPQVVKTRPIWPAMAAAAGIALIVGIVYWTQFASTPADPQKLFAEHFIPYEDLITQRSSTEQNALLNETMALYNAKDYARANAGFEALVAMEKRDPILHLYYANSLLAVKASGQALTQAQILLDSNDALLMPAARWYAALAYLQIDKVDAARSMLQQLKGESGPFGRRAEVLLNQLGG